MLRARVGSVKGASTRFRPGSGEATLKRLSVGTAHDHGLHPRVRLDVQPHSQKRQLALPARRPPGLDTRALPALGHRARSLHRFRPAFFPRGRSHRRRFLDHPGRSEDAGASREPAGARPGSEAGLPAGTELTLGKGRYRIARPADGGSVGRYLAEDLDSSRSVTLVSLRSSSLGPEATARFLERAGLLAALSAAHAGVPRVWASGCDDQRVFLVVEKPRGRPLDEVLAHAKRLDIDPA